MLAVTSACHKNSEQVSDHPRLTPKVVLRDVSFHSAALNREMSYRVLLPAAMPPGTKLPAVYLLHGGNGGFRDWSNDSDVARFAEEGLILVMPEGDESYYTNSAEHPQDRYEDYIVNDLIADVETRFPVASGQEKRAVVGVSMGGFGAVNLALRHPNLFAFVGGLSSAIDVPSRPFSFHRIGQWRHHESIFGPWGSSTRRDSDPFVLAHSADPAKVPISFSRAAIERAFFRQIAVSQNYCRSADSTMNSTSSPEVTTGTSGMPGWRIAFAACANIWNHYVKGREDSSSFFHIPFRELLCHN